MLIKFLKNIGPLVKVKRFFVKSTADKYDYIFDNLKTGDIAIDCGANIGDITWKMARNGARVYAFEPNPFVFERLFKRFNKNPNITCINKAVLDENTRVKLYFHKNSYKDEVYWSTGSSVLSFKKNIDRERYCEVDAVNLVDFIENLKSKVGVLKIDVEGAECAIINALLDFGTYENIGTVLVETHDDKIPELREETEKVRRRISSMKLDNFLLDWI
jgi:FkbM family methyltransferase